MLLVASCSPVSSVICIQPLFYTFDFLLRFLADVSAFRNKATDRISGVIVISLHVSPNLFSLLIQICIYFQHLTK